jgi:poly-gamma-glutamate synthesis protein (capsule biosynthesis protein)
MLSLLVAVSLLFGPHVQEEHMRMQQSLHEVNRQIRTVGYAIERIDEGVFQNMLGRSYHPEILDNRGELRMVTVPYVDFDGVDRQGELIVDHGVAEEIGGIFNDLYEIGFPIRKIQRACFYDGDDQRLMASDITSAFNHRTIAGTSRLSLHAHGRAVDLNPLENPYVLDGTVLPSQGRAFLDRNMKKQGLLGDGDPAVEAFVRRGWRWGGYFQSIKDYQHFDKPFDQVID